MPSYGPHYGPFASRTAAQIGLCRMADRKFGPDIGVAWQDGQFAQLFRPPVKTPDGLTKMLVVEHLGPVRMPPPAARPAAGGGNKVPSNKTLAWDSFNTAVDAVAVVLAVASFEAAFAALSLPALTAGAVCLIVFTAVEVVNSFAMFFADGLLTLAEYGDRITGGEKYENALKKYGLFNFVETWGPIIALPAIGKDIADFMKFRRIGCELEELTRDINRRLGILAHEMVMTSDDFILEHMKTLRGYVSDIEKGLEKKAENIRDIWHKAFPADLWALINDGHNLGDIRDGVEEDFRDWMQDVSGWVSRPAAQPRYSSPIAWAAAHHAAPTQMVYKSTNHVRLHVITAKSAGKAK
mgnify:FL=1|nr:hypothetical protein [uncultured Acidocella sp.]